MGFGGVLAAMAQGIGNGIVKNVEQGWKSEEADKLLAWKEKESDKQRAFDSEQLDKKHRHEFELEDRKSRNTINEAVAKARITAQHSRSGAGSIGGISQAQKDLTGTMQVLGVYDAHRNYLQQQLSATEDKVKKDAILKRIESLSNERAKYLRQPGTITAFKNAGQMGNALYMTSGGDMDLFNPKPKVPEVQEVKPTIAPPQRNIVDMNNLSAKEVAQLAKQKQEEQSRMSFAKASEEAKEWAAKQNQYTPSTFTPRTF